MILDITNISSEELRDIKKVIEAELSRRHKEKQKEKCNCWTCGHCFYDKDAHISYPRSMDRGDYKCMAWGKKGRIIPTKHKAPTWCPVMKGEKK